ncbi:MAG: threonine--tRNA ligase [Ilumatobacteraceae bacterium]|nr:threonine--tRNA ligase [Ilumatobacteraceae bacterium]
MSDITIKLPDGTQKAVTSDATALSLASSISRNLAKAAISAVIDDKEVDLSTPLNDGNVVHIITVDSEAGRHVLRHSTAHVMAQAVLQMYPGAKYTIGPAIENGFYYDFDLGDRVFTEDDLSLIEDTMRKIIAANQPFVRSDIPVSEALTLFAAQPYKCEIIARVTGGGADSVDNAEVGGSGDSVSIYRNTDEFVDLCLGPHVASTGRLGHFKLQKVSSAYWRGNEKGPVLQRIYGTAWESKAALEEYLHRLVEAERRDHRKLAVELDLLSFPSELGGGLAVWHPKGAIIRKLMEDYSRARHQSGGYQFVFTPHLSNATLFQTSGHLDFYADGMYPPMEMDNGTYYPKPMNCPMHCLIFRGRQRSYRELPLRLFELGTVYRYERAGTLHGLMRIRGFTQDDSHIFCTQDQLQSEIISLLDFVMSVLKAFGFEDFSFHLSTKDPVKYVGSDEIWETATGALVSALDAHGVTYSVKEGDAAFYGPKIDIHVRDAIGRTWQLSTIQCDFNLPERFDLEYVANDGSRQRPIMLHRALFGSVERFFGVLVEHYAGAFPTWLSPIQVRILPVALAHEEYAQKVADILIANGLRVDISEASDQLGKRIRVGKLEKIPYVLVVGDEDISAQTVGVNARGADVERGVSISSFAERVLTEISFSDI